MDMLKTKLGTLAQMPKQKFVYPMTQNQEIGWDMDTEFKTYQPKYGVNKVMCNETKYADNFVTFQGRSPFAQVRAEGAAAATTKK